MIQSRRTASRTASSTCSGNDAHGPYESARTLCRGALLVTAGSRVSLAPWSSLTVRRLPSHLRDRLRHLNRWPGDLRPQRPSAGCQYSRDSEERDRGVGPDAHLTDIRDMDVASNGIVSPPDFKRIFRVHGLPDGPSVARCARAVRGPRTCTGETRS